MTQETTPPPNAARVTIGIQCERCNGYGDDREDDPLCPMPCDACRGTGFELLGEDGDDTDSACDAWGGADDA